MPPAPTVPRGRILPAGTDGGQPQSGWRRAPPVRAPHAPSGPRRGHADPWLLTPLARMPSHKVPSGDLTRRRVVIVWGRPVPLTLIPLPFPGGHVDEQAARPAHVPQATPVNGQHGTPRTDPLIH